MITGECPIQPEPQREELAEQAAAIADASGSVLIPEPAQAPAVPKGRGFVTNVLWGWAGVAATISVGLVLPPFVIRTLGTEMYGVWTLVFSTMDYFRLFDLGFGAAIINYCARARARCEYQEVNEILNTGLLYFAGVGAFLLAISLLFGSRFADVFHVVSLPAWQTTRLVGIIGVSVGISLASAPVAGALEAFQHFDAVNRAFIITLYVRTVAWFALLFMGHGLIAMAYTAIVCQCLQCAMNLFSLRRVFPEMRLSLRHAHFSTLKGMTSFGIHSFLVNVSNLMINQGGSVFIGFLDSVRGVAYFNVPFRILLYVGELVPRVGYVTTSKAAELDASGRQSDLRSMAVYTNRYCYLLFAPVALFLTVFRYEIVRVWINADFAAHSAPLIPVLAISVVLTMAGQFNSGAILIGQGKHPVYAYGLMAESALLVALFWLTIPRYGVLGAAYSMGLLMLLSRGLLPAWLLARYNGFSFAGFLAGVYLLPTLAAAPVAAVVLILKHTILSGNSLPSLFAAAAVTETLYMVIAFFTCIQPEHRRAVIQRVKAMAPRRVRSGAALSS